MPSHRLLAGSGEQIIALRTADQRVVAIGADHDLAGVGILGLDAAGKRRCAAT